MVAGLKFLSKKSFNPQNNSNQKTVWERQQERAQAEKRSQEREKQLQRERDDEELQRARGEPPRLQFLYAAPPGLEARAKEEGTSSEPTATANRDEKPASSHAHEQPPSSAAGNLDPAAAFRDYLESAKRRAAEKEEAASKANGEVSCKDDSQQTPGSFGTVLQGTSHDPVQAALDKTTAKAGASSSALSALEKAVGRKHQHAVSGSLSLEEQIQRFPALANAPRQKGISASHVGVSFKPLGAQIRNVRCMACGIWGHSKGERECRVSGWNPFDSAAGGGGGGGGGGGATAQIVAPASHSLVGSTKGAAASSSQERVPPSAEHRDKQRQSRRDAFDKDEKRRREGRYDRDGRSGGFQENTDIAGSENDEDEDSRDSRRRNHHRRKRKKHKSKHRRSRSRRREDGRKRRSESDSDRGESEGSGSDSGSESESSRRKRKKHRKHRDR